MKFAYHENRRLIETLGNVKNRDFLVNSEIANLRSCAKISEKTAASWINRSIHFHERANELEMYLDTIKEKCPCGSAPAVDCGWCENCAEYAAEG